MCIIKQSRLRCSFALAAFALLWASVAKAHPVAQGALDIRVLPTRVDIVAHVSSEEVLVEAAYAGAGDASYADKRRRHGDYLLRHLQISADGRALAGRISAFEEQAAASVYTLEYVLPEAGAARITIGEDVLREFEYAPGNPWEASYLAQISGAHGAIGQRLLTVREPLAFDTDTSVVSSAATYSLAGAFLRHGVMHILTGYDHLLFVAALLLAVTTFWDLVKVISVFTLAHTITLTLAALDLFRLPETVVEPMIAASIVAVAVQNVFWPSQSRGKGRLLLAFGFGLFHGLGFAGGLLDAMASLPAMHATVAIAAFSLGVEIGHQVVVLPLFFGRRALLASGITGVRGDHWVQRYGSVAISCAGAVYLVAALR